MFSIDFDKLILSLLPWFLRKEVMISWINALISPIAEIYVAFISYRESKLFEAKISGQVMSLEYMLNMEFYDDGTLRQIYISDGNTESEVFIYNTSENEENTFIFNASENEDDTYLFNSSESTGYDFIVYVPDDLDFDIEYITSLINKYKLAGPSFTIVTY